MPPPDQVHRPARGSLRVLLRLPSREEYVAGALDETIAVGGSSPQVRWRVERLLTELPAVTPADRADGARARLAGASAEL